MGSVGAAHSSAKRRPALIGEMARASGGLKVSRGGSVRGDTGGAP